MKQIRKNKLILTVLLLLALCGCADVSGYLPSDTPGDTSSDTPVISVSEIPANEEASEVSISAEPNDLPEEETAEEPDNSEESEEASEDEADKETEVDLIFFMGQSNMAGAGGNEKYAPKVPEECGYEFRAISDPTRLYPITEPFGINENNLNAIMDLPGAKKGSLVSAFVNRYYELTGTPIVAVSASAGATDTDFWKSDRVVADYSERIDRAVVWLESSGYKIRHKYVIWLQGESDAIDNTTSEEYETNMDTIIRPMFIKGFEKVFFITPGRTITRKDYFKNIIAAQIKMSRESSYYALGTTVLSAISTEYMVDEWHYNQTVLNLIGKECAESAAFYTLNGKECCLFNYRDNTAYVPENTEADPNIAPLDFSKCDLLKELN